MKNIIIFFLFIILFPLLGLLQACGVSGPPLPPLSVTPEDSDRLTEDELVQPSPSAVPSSIPSPAPKTEKNLKKKSKR